MDIQKALENIKVVCDDAVKTGRFSNLDEAAAIIESFNCIVASLNLKPTPNAEKPKPNTKK